MDYSKTLNLPQTDFPMRGNLPQQEPLTLAKWEKANIYEQVAAKNAGKPKFILHDGPPYANGNIHLGHVLNKVLKDIIVKYKSMSGFDAPYVPGWDTHGLPIEQKAIKDLGLDRHKISKSEFRNKCTEYALSYVNIQREQFKRLGVRGDWGNPYVTLDPVYEAVQIKAFGEMAKKGYIYKGKKPVYWCADCETALAEAEVEYADHKTAAIYVKFAVRDSKGKLPDDAYFVIWTTTPWTIPANLAICLHAEYTYVLAEIDGEKWVLAEDLLQAFLDDTGRQAAKVLQKMKGKELEGLICKHPLYERDSLVILGEHVTLDAGTGCVHTAPGHGVDDFEVGQRYGLPILSPVDDRGYMTEEAGGFAGLNLADANKAVCKALESCGALVGFKMINHQYPHCWRCKKPIVFRATEQWFASISGFRDKALAEIDKTTWIPAWGHDRIYNMVRDRSDWCISRQRTWGVPIPIFYCQECGKDIITDETINRIAELFAAHSSNVWFDWDEEKLLPEGFVCPHCGGTHFRKETDIMDVWFDSGSSHLAVLETRPDLSWPADLYLEGSDQHRGWFNSSLSVAVAVKGQAPYKAVLTHGFLVDEQGRKLSKSLGNAIDPLQVIDKMGADVLRLWVSSAEYRSDLANSPNIMKQISEAYRKIRNTARFLLSNLYDFDPNKDQVPYDRMPELDRWMLHRLSTLVRRVLQGYENYDFHVVYHAIHRFCVVEMSNLYLDITKDRLYALTANDERRRAAQTVMYQVINSLVRLLVPILAYTTEEIYLYMPKEKGMPAGVQLLDMPPVHEEWLDEALNEKWERIVALREVVAKALEEARAAKVIGHSLDAHVTLYTGEEFSNLVKSLGEEAPSIFIVSQLTISDDARPDECGGTDEIGVVVNKAVGKKCERCWIYSPTVGKDEENPTICQRCAKELAKQK